MNVIEMPSNYTVMGIEELMYVEGGSDWVEGDYFTSEDCQKIASYCNRYSPTASALAAYIASSLGTNLGALLLTLAISDYGAHTGGIFQSGANANGVKLMYKTEEGGGTVNPNFSYSFKWVVVN